MHLCNFQINALTMQTAVLLVLLLCSSFLVSLAYLNTRIVMFELCHLAFDYQDAPLLNDINIQLFDGDLLHIQGANGAGKTTLLKLIAGLHHPSSGEIRYKGQSIQKNLAEYQRLLCFVGHKTGISPHLTIKENCYFDIHYSKQKNILELASIFKLEHHINSPCSNLSSGQKRQVGLLRLWLTDARIWLLDEPFIALDENALSTLMDKIQVHRKQGGIVLLTSHQDIPLGKSDYVEYFL